MSLKLKCYAGNIGWFARKFFPYLASWGYLNSQYCFRHQLTGNYIDWFMKQPSPPQPIIISIETINRCNSKCGFCAASIQNEKRPFSKMKDEVFFNIVQQLADWNYKNMIALYINNEPLIDERIFDFYMHLRSKLPKATLLLFTNGTLLSPEKLDKLADCIDVLIINNYSEQKKLHDNLQSVCHYVTTNEYRFSKMEILIQFRYTHEVLTNRAGTAPNKKAQTIHKEKCLLPYTDISIFPDGRLGLCCNDFYEVTDFGNILEGNIQELWQGIKYHSLREHMKKGRNNYEYCKHCDFVDAGIRENYIKAYVHSMKQNNS